MEDTLAAREKLEQTRAARRNAPGESSSLTGSLTANYSHHQKEWAMQIRALQHRQVCIGRIALMFFAFRVVVITLGSVAPGSAAVVRSLCSSKVTYICLNGQNVFTTEIR